MCRNKKTAADVAVEEAPAAREQVQLLTPFTSEL